MNPGKIVLTTVLTVFTLLAFAAVGASAFLSNAAEAHGLRGHFGGAASGHRGSAGHERMLAHCERLGPAHTRVVEAMVSAALDLNDAQETALEPVMAVLDDWRADAVSTCESLPIDSVDGGLAAMQQLLATSATAMEAMRPAYASFEGTLNDDQRAQITAMINRHHGR